MPSTALLLTAACTPASWHRNLVSHDIHPGEPRLRFNILCLPPELRLAVYAAILIDSNDDSSLNLLRVCRQIDMEARSITYQRPTSFASQAKFLAWIDRSRARNLHRVRRVTLRLTDVDLSPLLDPNNARRQTRTSAWSLYKADLERLEQALSALPSLANLTVIPPNIGRSQLLRNMYHSFLAAIPRRCPKLQRLELQDNEELLKLVPALNDVKRVTFTSVAEVSREIEIDDDDAAAAAAAAADDVQQDQQNTDATETTTTTTTPPPIQIAQKSTRTPITPEQKTTEVIPGGTGTKRKRAAPSSPTSLPAAKRRAWVSTTMA